MSDYKFKLSILPKKFNILTDFKILTLLGEIVNTDQTISIEINPLNLSQVIIGSKIVEPYELFADLPTTGVEKVLYIITADGSMYYWNGTTSAYELANRQLIYSLPIASGTTLGGVKIGDSLSIGVDGTVNVNSIAIVDTYVVSSESAMLELTQATKGDIAIRTDVHKTFILSADPYSVLENWIYLETPTDVVLSVNGKVGAVVLTQDDIGDGTTYKQYSLTEKTKLASLPESVNIVKRTSTLTDTIESVYTSHGREIAIDGATGSYFVVAYKNTSNLYDVKFVGTQQNSIRGARDLAGTSTISEAFNLATTDYAKLISGAIFASLATSVSNSGYYTISDDTSATYLKGSTYFMSSAGVRTMIPLGYNNSTTGLTATNVQSAIDEVVSFTSRSEVIQVGINKYYPLLSNRAGQLLAIHITSVWNAGAWITANSNGFGVSALQNNTGVYSNGFGSYALQNNTGAYSSGFGIYALQNNTGVDSNGFGISALQSNTGAYSGGFGYAALQNNTGAYSNGFGNSALRYNTGGYSNSFGTYALQYNTGAYSSGFGSYALRYNQKPNNTAFGHSANAVFLPDTSRDKTCDYTAIDTTLERATITSHGFGSTSEYVNIRYTSTTGTAIGGLTINTIYQVKIIDANTIEFYDGSAKHNLSSQGVGTHTFTPQFAYTNNTCLGANTIPTKDNQVVLGDTNVVNIRAGNYDTTTKDIASINYAPTSVALTLESILANTSGYFDTTGSGTSGAPYVVKPKVDISHSGNLYTITSSQPASNIYINIQGQGNQPCNIRYTYPTLFTTYFYTLQVLNSDGKVRPRMTVSADGTTVTPNVAQINHSITFTAQIDINSNEVFSANITV